MSIEAMSWVLNHAPVSHTDKLVLLGIASHADSDGANAWPGIARLARYASVSERSVSRSIARLRDAGLLHVEVNQGGTHATDPKRRPNRYTILTDSVSTGVTPVSSLDGQGVTPVTLRDDTRGTQGVTPVSSESSLNRPEPSADSATPTCGQCDGGWIDVGTDTVTPCPHCRADDTPAPRHLRPVPGSDWNRRRKDIG